MIIFNFIRERGRVSRSLRLVLVFSNILVLLINLFVGLLVYQNPLIALTDMQNLFSVLLFSAGLSAVIYLGALFAGYFERYQR